MTNDGSAKRIGSSTPIGAQAKAVRLLHQTDLSRRWNVSPRTLERWRWQGKGPRYLKIGGRVRYRLEDIEAYEAANVHEAGDESNDGEDPAKPPLTTRRFAREAERR